MRLYMFQALLAHPQEALQSTTWYIACVLCQLAARGSQLT
jgi:phenylpropionate dioxygenase-like ring-hydroxylating dioxygenase large terminal subunit